MGAIPLLLMLVSANAARELALSTHSGVDGSSNYYVVPGGWYPSNYDIICYGTTAKPYLPEYALANRFSAVITAQICDSISDCGSFNQGLSYPNTPCIKVPGTRNSQYIIYMHRSRCSATQTATTFTSSDQQPYKVCEGVDAFGKIYATFALPQFLCEESCERDSSCVGYASSGQNCSLLQYPITDVTSYSKLYGLQ
jgi:hypothetical protein